jgi:UDP-N-acetylmuramate dehydrogenase
VDGVIVKAGGNYFEVDRANAEPRLIAEAGANLANLARRVSKLGLSGLEWAANVPGTVGGAVVNNAGAFGSSAAACLVSATLTDAAGRQIRLAADELGYAYRTSVLKRREFHQHTGDAAVEVAEFRLRPSSPGEADGLVKQYNAQRMRSQPRILSAGSVFANPEGSFSGKLIEEAGLKRTRIGGAQISEQHANFIVNPGGATARDVYALMRQAQDVVYAKTGIWLRPEIELLGRWTAEERAALERARVSAHG